MFKNKKIVLFLLVLPLVAVLVAPKVALADDDSDWVKNIPIIGGVVDFASDPGGWITDRFAEGAEFFFNDGLQNIKTTSTKSILGKSFNNLLGKKTGTFYSTVSFVNKSVVMPTAGRCSIMNDGNDKHEGAWWGNLETLKPSQVQSDYSYVDEDDRRKKFIIIAAVIGIVLVLLLGGVTAFTVLSSNKGNDSDTKKEQTQTQKKETSTENAKKKKSAEKSAIFVMVTADGAAEDSKASVSVSEKGKNGKIVVKDISVAVNDEVKICTLPKGKYLLTVESPPDGYDKPAKSTSFTVKGDGKKVSAFAFLAKHVDKTAESSKSEDNAEVTPADGASQNQNASSDGQNQNNQAENSSAGMDSGASSPSSGNGQPSSASTSSPTKTMTIHHPAETIRIAICDTCGADITDDIEGHKKSTGHPWYHYDAKVVKEAWDETVTVN